MTPSFPSCLISPRLESNRSFAAQIVRDSLCDYTKSNKGMRKSTSPTYGATNRRSYNAAGKQRGSLLIWLVGCFQPTTGPIYHLYRCGDPDMADVEGALRVAFAANDRTGGQPTGACWAGLVGAGFQHALPPPERSGRCHTLSPEQLHPAFPDRGLGHQDRGLRRVARHGTRPSEAAPVAQSLFGYRC